MAKGVTIVELKRVRIERGLTMEQAGALIRIDGEPTGKATWCGWESGKKVPKPPAMFELERVFGIPPNAFYPRPDGGAVEEPAQRALAL
jgi:transcriptional regulator with XRE-family HTH domain